MKYTFKSKAACIVDQSGNILWYLKHKRKLWPASITKLATAMVFIELGGMNLETRVTPKAAKQRKKRIGLKIGEEVSGEFLLHAMLMESGNDAAWAAAETFGNCESFVDKMNKLAKQLGMNQTKFVNPTGLPVKGQYSTPLDLTKLGLALTNYPMIMNIIRKNKTNFSTSRKNYVLKNTNPLLGKKAMILGGKTGSTFGQGKSLLLITQNGDEKKVLVVQGANNKQAVIEDMMYLIEKNC